MRCRRCKEKALSRKTVEIICKVCKKQVEVSYFNNNICEACNDKAGTCSECGRKIEE